MSRRDRAPRRAASQPEEYLWGRALGYASADPTQEEWTLRPSSQRWYADYLRFVVGRGAHASPPEPAPTEGQARPAHH